MRNPDLAEAVLEELYTRRDSDILSHQLRSCVPQFSVVSKTEWEEALDDLRLADLVNVQLIPSEDDAGQLDLHSSLRMSHSGFEEIRQLKEVEAYAAVHFRDWSEPLYSDLDLAGADIREKYAHRGALRSSSYYRAVANLILDRLRGLEQAFVASFLRPIEDRTAAGVDALRERWLLRRLESLWKTELQRAKTNAGRLCQSSGALPADYSSQISELGSQAEDIKRSITRKIEIAGAEHRLPVLKGRDARSSRVRASKAQRSRVRGAVADSHVGTHTNTSTASVELFVAYSHEDEPLKDELIKHFSSLRRSGIIQEWHDRRIQPGADWEREIDDAVSRCQIILLLVSANFIHSDYCYGIELKRALERHEHDQAQVIPVILRPCDWTHLPFARFQALPKDGKAVTTWPIQDEAYTEITRGIRTLASQVPSSSFASDSQTPASGPSLRSTVGPELVIDYNYTEEAKDHHNAEAPLVIRNISNTEHAYNIQVLPLETEQGALDFKPALIPYIEAAKSKNVFACIKEGSPVFKRRLPDFLFKTYRDESVEELFGTKVFTICIQYKGAGSSTFETRCEILFRPWKKQVTVGRIERKTLSP